MFQVPIPLTSGAGPFAALSLIVAPAILTNACSLLVMSTSNRLARAVDLTRSLARELESTVVGSDANESDRLLREMQAAQQRSLLLVRSLGTVYSALAGFATATLVALLGVVFSYALSEVLLRVFEIVALAAGIVGVGGIVWAAALLIRETRIAVNTLRERVAAQQVRFGRG